LTWKPGAFFTQVLLKDAEAALIRTNLAFQIARADKRPVERSKTMRMKLWILGATLSLLAAAPAGAIKVYKTTSEGLADVKIYVTKSEGLADCIIYVESSEGLANGNAKWYFENSEGLADIKVYFTDSEGLADKKIYFTNSRGLARCDVDWKSYKK
jgi:hypothetical protein